MITLVGRSDTAFDSHSKTLPRLHLEMLTGELHLHEAVGSHLFVSCTAVDTRLDGVSLLAVLWRSLVGSIV